MRLPGSLSPRFVLLHAAIPCAVPVISLPAVQGTPIAGQGFVSRSPLPATVAPRSAGPLRFLEDPGGPWPCSPTPAGPIPPGLSTVVRHGPRLGNALGYPRVRPSRGSIARLWPSLSTLRPVGCPRPDARRASHCGPGSVGRDWLPAGSYRKVSGCPSPLPRLILTQCQQANMPPASHVRGCRIVPNRTTGPSHPGQVLTADNPRRGTSPERILATHKCSPVPWNGAVGCTV